MPSLAPWGQGGHPSRLNLNPIRPRPPPKTKVRKILDTAQDSVVRLPQRRDAAGGGGRGDPGVQDFPDDHRVKLAPMNPRSGSNQEIGRHTDVVGILPNEAVVIRLVDAVLTKQHDEW